MQLQIFHTGNVVATCGEDGVHTPTVWYFNGFPVRVIFRPNLPADRALAFVKTDAAKALGYKSAHQAGKTMGFIQGEDKDGSLILTPGGPQKITVLTFKGLSKLLMRSDHKTALEFQDWLAGKSSDLAFHGFAIADKSAIEAQMEPGMVSVSRDGLKWLADRVVELEKAIGKSQARQGLVLKLDSLESSNREIAAKLDGIMLGLAAARPRKPRVKKDPPPQSISVLNFHQTQLLRSGAETRAADLFAAYQGYCARNGAKAVSQNLFGRTLNALGLRKRRTRECWLYEDVELIQIGGLSL